MIKKLLFVFALFFWSCGMYVGAQQLSPVVAKKTNYTLNVHNSSLLNVTPKGTEKWMGYWSGDTLSNLSMVGVNHVPMDYSAAIGYPAGFPMMEGKTIEGIRFMLTSSPYITNVKVWISTFLPGTAESADICCQTVKKVEQLNEVRFTVPYKVDSSKPVYVGFAFHITQGNTDAEHYPIVYSTEKVVPNSFLLKFGGKGQKWSDYYKNGFGVLALQTLVSGQMRANDVDMLADFGDAVGLKDGVDIPLTLDNLGTQGVDSLSFLINVGGVESETTVVLENKVTGLGEKFAVKARAEVPEIPAIYDCTVKVVKVNGEPFTKELSSTGKICVLSRKVPGKVLVEEFTGMWCGNCPRGMVGMEKLRQEYGQDIVLVAVHNNDALECKDYSDVVGQTVSGFPAAHVNRTFMGVDPYYGLGSSFGINNCVKFFSENLPVATITAVPELRGDTLVATAEVEFLYSGNSSNYAVGYVLTENGMKRTNWVQSNYLSGQNDLLKEDPLFEPWVNAGNHKVGVTFDDVAIAAKGIAGGIKGSVPDVIEDGVKVEHTTKFSLNRYAKILNRGSLNLGVILFDKKTGRVVNADMKPVGESTGIVQTTTDFSDVEVVARYALDGRLLTAPQKGLIIEKYSNGMVRKVFVK